MHAMTSPVAASILWDVVPVQLAGTPHTILLARVWMDVLSDTNVNHDEVRHELAKALNARPEAATAAASIAREAHVRALPAPDQANWLIDQVRSLSGLPPRNPAADRS